MQYLMIYFTADPLLDGNDHYTCSPYYMKLPLVKQLMRLLANDKLVASMCK